MCGRYFLIDDENQEDIRMIIEQINRRYPDTEEQALMRLGEITPGMVVPVMAHGRKQQSGAFLMKWGFRSPTGKGILINARSETARAKPIFAQPLQQRRCAIPANFYFEWEKRPEGKQKYKIAPKGQQLCYLAGIYRYEENARLPVFTVLTRAAAPEIQFIHDRMPVMLLSRDVEQWLDQGFIQQHALCDTAYATA